MSNKIKKKVPTSITVELSESIMFGDVELTTITITQPKWKHMKQIDISNQVEFIDMLVSKCSDMPDNLTDELAARDILSITKKAEEASFLG